MARNLSIALMGSAMAGAFMLVAPAMTWSAEAKKAEDAVQIVQRMETHWQTLIRERDPARRKVLIAEHRQMMAESRAALGATPSGPMGDHGRGSMMGSHHQHDLQNTMELHSMMLDMMQ
ncbi:MAG: hypothetical protein ACYCZQ_15420 [Burkholderiales bacterium]